MIPTDEIISMANQCGLPLTYVPHYDGTFSPHVDGLARFATLVSARAAVIEREKVDALVEAMQSVIAAVEACEGTWDDNDFPLHAHEKSGIWDDDNSNDQSGQPCVECAQWKALRAALAKAQGDGK